MVHLDQSGPNQQPPFAKKCSCGKRCIKWCVTYSIQPCVPKGVQGILLPEKNLVKLSAVQPFTGSLVILSMNKRGPLIGCDRSALSLTQLCFWNRTGSSCTVAGTQHCILYVYSATNNFIQPWQWVHSLVMEIVCLNQLGPNELF